MAENQQGVAPPLADPAPLGLAAFALTTFAFSIVNAGIIPEGAINLFIPLALLYGGLAQLIAGLFAFRTVNIFASTAFVSYGAFWIALGTVEIFVRQLGIAADAVGPALAWFFVGWTIFTVIMLIGSFQVHLALGVTFTLLTVTFVLLAAAFFIPVAQPLHMTVLHLGGYVGIATAAAAWYIVAADVLNTVYGRELLPLGAK